MVTGEEEKVVTGDDGGVVRSEEDGVVTGEEDGVVTSEGDEVVTGEEGPGSAGVLPVGAGVPPVSGCRYRQPETGGP